MERCRALIVGAEEDFGIAAVEAMAAGAAVAAFGRGGVAETVTDGHTGILFGQQDVAAAVRSDPAAGVARLSGGTPGRRRRPLCRSPVRLRDGGRDRRGDGRCGAVPSDHPAAGMTDHPESAAGGDGRRAGAKPGGVWL